VSGRAARNFACFLTFIFQMLFYDLFNITVEMTPRRTVWVCIVVALFFIAAAALYDASAMIDAPVRALLGTERKPLSNS
jgi:hypothetical protein